MPTVVLWNLNSVIYENAIETGWVIHVFYAHHGPEIKKVKKTKNKAAYLLAGKCTTI